MKGVTPIATRRLDNVETHRACAIVGSTPGVELDALIDMLTAMGGQELSDTAAQQWEALVASSGEDKSAFLEELNATIELAQKPVLLPIVFNAEAEPLDQVMARFDSAALLLFYARPESLLVKALTDDKSPTVALQRWCSAARSMLESVHRYRNRAVLFSAEASVLFPPAFVDRCREFLGLQGGFPKRVSIPAQESAVEIHRLIAVQMVAQSLEVQDLLNELEASAIPSDTLPMRVEVNCEEVLAAWRKTAELEELKEENELLLLQLHQVLQEELESYELQYRDVERKLLDAERKLDDSKKELREKEAKLCDALEELSSREQVIKRKDKTIRNKDAACKKMRARIVRLQEELSGTRAYLDYILGSKSWRWTQPLRRIRQLFGTTRSASEE